MSILKIIEGIEDGEEVWTAISPEYNYVPNSYSAIRVENGLKILCKKETLDNLMSNKEITEKFQLNVRRKNRWHWSVYFKEI